MTKLFAKALSSCSDFIRSWSGFFAVQSLESDWQKIVFYAESRADWAHMEPVVKRLTKHHSRQVTCITSDPADPILNNVSPAIKAIYIGSGSARTALFQAIKARAFVMTLTDLNSYYLKRSSHPVHYFYIFHALVSTHAAYRQYAFDAYDTVFCVGPYHRDEIREQEKVYSLKPKNLAEGGYCRLDLLIEEVRSRREKPEAATPEGPTVLVAPTWGDSSMVGNCLEKVLDALTAARIRTILRFHPMTLRHYPDLPQQMRDRYSHSGCFEFDDRLKSIESLLQADIMIADHGGSGIEFAFGLEKPVIWVATPPKIHNPGRDRIGLPLFEDSIRSATGVEIATDRLEQLPETVRSIYGQTEAWKSRIAGLREKNIFNVGKSAEVMADYIAGYAAAK